jgi:hypothetical protein
MTPEGVIETFFLDWPFCFATGVLFGIAGRAEIARAATPFATRAFRWGMAYLHAGILSVALGLYLARPDWMWMYWVQDARMPVVVVVIAFALYEVCFLAGFSLGPALGARPRALWFAAATAGAAFTAGEIASRTRLLHLGTFEEFSSGVPPEIMFDPFRVSALGWVLLVVVPVSFAALTMLAVRLARAR